MQREAIIGLALVITLAVLAPNQSQVELNDDGISVQAPHTSLQAETAEQSEPTGPDVYSQPHQHVEDAAI